MVNIKKWNNRGFRVTGQVTTIAMLTNRRSTQVQHKSLLKGNYNIMLITQNTTSRTLQGACHMKYTNLCNEEKRTKPSTPRYLTKRPNHK